jgi:hypothetical protein
MSHRVVLGLTVNFYWKYHLIIWRRKVIERFLFPRHTSGTLFRFRLRIAPHLQFKKKISKPIFKKKLFINMYICIQETIRDRERILVLSLGYLNFIFSIYNNGRLFSRSHGLLSRFLAGFVSRDGSSLCTVPRWFFCWINLQLKFQNNRQHREYSWKFTDVWNY